MSDTQQAILWSPNRGPQKALIDCPYPEIGFGGARGGGKTEGVLGKYAIKSQRYGKKFNAVFFRQEMPQADDLIDRAREIYDGIGALWHDQKKYFIMPGGGRIRFRPLENVADAAKYQGQNLTDAAVEEAGNYPDPRPIDMLFGALRSSKGVPTQLIQTFNPGGEGHGWLKERYWDPAPHGMVPLIRKLPNGKEHRYIFIPSRVQDNPTLLVNDPGYIDRLHLVGSAELVRAWLEGDFEIHEGAYFPEFGARHIVRPFPIPRHWAVHVGFDWGYASPFCCLWGAVSSGKDDNGNESPIPKGAIVIYREIYKKGVTNPEIGKLLRAAQPEYEDPKRRVADPSIFKEDGGASIAEQIRNGGAGYSFSDADNTRLSGWSQYRQRFLPDPALIYIFSTCSNLIREIRGAQHDEKHPEDLNTELSDHALDACRYLLMSRPVTPAEFAASQPSVKRGRVRVAQYIKAVRDQAKNSRI